MNNTKCKIVVYDYYDVIKGASPWHWDPNKVPVKYEVEAYCVGGALGIFAYFYIGDKFCMASGDDGAWRMAYSCHSNWVAKFKKVWESLE